MSLLAATRRAVFVILWSLALLSGASPARGGAPAPIEFNRDIRPILSDNCFACHGPDGRKREAGLRLDREKEAKDKLESGAVAVVPGKSGESALVARIISTDPEERMPPADSGKQLTAEQIELLKRWIDSGAPWEGHWSFEPIKRPTPPTEDDAAFVKNGIDPFVLAKLREVGLKHAPEADRVTLIRRLSFDLVGLPPTPAEVERFVADTDPKAYELLVDRLLESPHFGERLAMFWLDLVRYADTVGYHGDQEIRISPYRDYVIKSFNENKRFDRFTIEQIAGDILPDATLETRIASGYNRLGMMTAEGGAQAKEYLSKYASERVRNASGAWLGVTMGCCECHDHKFDPFTTKEFYQFEAFFAGIEERGVYSGSEGTGKWGPILPLANPTQQAELTRLGNEKSDVNAQLNQMTAHLNAEQAEWEKKVAPAIEWTVLKPVSATAVGGATLATEEDASILASGPAPETDTYTLSFKAPPGPITAIRLEVLPSETLPENGCGRAESGNFVLTEFTASLTSSTEASAQAIPFASATATFEQPVEGGPKPKNFYSAASAIDGNLEARNTGWAVYGEIPLANYAVFEVKGDVVSTADSLLTVTLVQNYGGAHTIGHFRVSVTTAERPVIAQGAGLSRDIRDALATPAAKRNKAQRKALADHYRSLSPALAPLVAKVAEIDKAREQLEEQIPFTLVTKAAKPRVMRVLARGNWMDESGEIVEPGVPASLPLLSISGKQGTRLDLARWLVSAENPLTSRALVNRLWKIYFGAGLSKKLDDLGAQGEWPSHPLLLDYLAGQLVDSGWDLKRTIKLMVTSGAYRQSSVATAEQTEKDPYNRWLGHQGRFRLDAELVRDNALAISGLLASEIGGVSVKPYQPAGYWSYLNFPLREWQNGAGDQLYRRGLYTHWQRQYLHPSLLAFDAPSREECTAERVRSNTPLQSLALLNDPTYVEAARVFAEHTIREGGSTTADRLDWAMHRATSRALRPAERELLAALYDKHLGEYRGDATAATALISTGAYSAPKDIDAAELAAWTSVCRVIINLHETITRN